MFKLDKQEMTKEEAIAYGRRVIDLGLNDETQAFCEMAVKALEQEPILNKINKHCDYCHCDKEGYVKPIDKRAHVFVDTTIHEGNIVVNFNGLSRKYPIKHCPMCGRKF